MKKILVSLIALASFISFSVFPAAGNISFSGNAVTTCSFTSQINGTLSVDPASPSILASNASNGTPAVIGIGYFGTPTVSIEEISAFATKPSGVNNSDFTFNTTVDSGAGKTYTSSSGYKTYTYSSGSADTLTVNFLATKTSGSIPLGSYSTSSAITCQ